MIRVFHIISHFDLGGAEIVAVNIAKSKNPNIEYHIVEGLRGKSNYTPQFIKELKEHDIKYHRSLIPNIRFHFIFERLAALLFPIRFLWIYFKWHPNVIHTHTEFPDLCILATSKLFPWLLRNCKIVRTIHSNCLWTGQNYWGKIAEQFFQKNLSNVAISMSVQKSYYSRFNETPPIIYNGIELLPQKVYPNLKYNRINILFAGRFEKYKGVNILINVIKELAYDNRYYFHIIGEGTMSKYLKDRMSSISNVSISGPIYGLSSFLSSFDYMFMPSEFEGLSLMAIEASMAGLPTIINDAPGLAEIFPSDWPLKVSNNKLADYNHILKNVIPFIERKELSNKIHSYAFQRFSVNVMRQSYENFIYNKSN